MADLISCTVLTCKFYAERIACANGFIDAGAGVVDVDFDLPKVEVSGATTVNQWASSRHRLVSATVAGVAHTLCL